jgi:hypothetical protein
MLSILSSSDARRKLAIWRTSASSGEVKGIADGKMREMVINFGRVDSFTSVGLLHLLRADSLVVQDCIVAKMEAVGFPCDTAKQGRATRAWRTENT